MSQIQAVILDWAGTAVDYGCFAPVQAFIEVFSEWGITPTMDETRKPMGMLKREHIRTMLYMPRIHQLWMEKYQREVSEKDLDEMYSIFEDKLLHILSGFAEPKPYVIETVQALRDQGIKIGSTTGYTDNMMEIVVREAKRKGYETDYMITPDSTNNLGRPYPYMIFRNMEFLKVSSVKNVIKVGDTVSDIVEGKNAGVLSVGVIEGSSVMGLTQEEFEALTETEKLEQRLRVKTVYEQAGADVIVDDIRGVFHLIR